VLTFGTAIFVAAEFAFVTVDRAALDRAAEQGDHTAVGLRDALRSLSTQLSGAQLGITTTTLSVGYLVEPSAARLLGHPWFPRPWRSPARWRGPGGWRRCSAASPALRARSSRC
jgi:CBS domain containing-hemolysin-like protein